MQLRRNRNRNGRYENGNRSIKSTSMTIDKNKLHFSQSVNLAMYLRLLIINLSRLVSMAKRWLSFGLSYAEMEKRYMQGST